ncbi:MAG: TRAP transporter small permease [Candidatus Adiutrix sp.]|nr:TRAP transporter small permease [Candidatus Adiutrix sp.]
MIRIGDFLEKWVMGFLIVVCCTMVLIGGAQVFTRYLMDYSLYWSEEAMRYLFAWLVFLAMGLGIRRRAHVAIEVLIETLKPNGRRLLALLVMLLILLFCLAFTYYGCKLTMRNLTQLSPAMRLPMGWVYVSLPLGGLLAAFFTLEQIDILKKGESG